MNGTIRFTAASASLTHTGQYGEVFTVDRIPSRDFTSFSSRLTSSLRSGR